MHHEKRIYTSDITVCEHSRVSSYYSLAGSVYQPSF